MSRKFAILIIIVILLLILGGVFWWLERGKLMGERNIIEFEPPQNYIIKETSEGKIVENKKAGLSFKVPDDWKIAINEYKKGEGIVEIFTSEPDFYTNTGLPKKGCGIAVSTEYRSKEETGMVVNLIKLIKENQINPNIETNNKEVLEVDSQPALKSMIFDKPEMGQGFKIEVPVGKDRTYVFNTFVPSGEEKCPLEFDKFLATVSITVF